MVSHDRARDRGRRQAMRQSQAFGTELRDARLAAGLSQHHIARVAGLSQSRISRTEQGVRSSPTIDVLARHSAAVGLRLSLKAYPDGPPVRDEGQLRLLERFRSRLGHGLRWRSEVPVGGEGDLRAWDVGLEGAGMVGIDAETRLTDVQALQRRCELKWRDSQAEWIVLLVAATRHNRRVLALHREALRSTFPADTLEIMSALRMGRVPSSNGIVVL